LLSSLPQGTSNVHLQVLSKKSYFTSTNAMKSRMPCFRGGCFATDTNKLFANVIIWFGSMSVENSADERSLEFVFTRSLMKLFNTVNIDIINECCAMFNLQSVNESCS
jgi:hypothetical protein